MPISIVILRPQRRASYSAMLFDMGKCKCTTHLMCSLSYGPPWAHYLGGYQDRLLGGPLGLLDLRCTAPAGVKHKDYGGEVLG
jgi:hypothetical protein